MNFPSFDPSKESAEQFEQRALAYGKRVHLDHEGDPDTTRADGCACKRDEADALPDAALLASDPAEYARRLDARANGPRAAAPAPVRDWRDEPEELERRARRDEYCRRNPGPHCGGSK